MRGRGDRDELGAEIESPALQPGEHGGEPLAEEAAVEMAGIQPHVIGPVTVEHALHVTDDHIPGRQFGPRMRSDHEPLPRVVHQVGALASQRPR